MAAAGVRLEHATFAISLSELVYGHSGSGFFGRPLGLTACCLTGFCAVGCWLTLLRDAAKARASDSIEQ
ncbi:MAG TPA: hypothetical protein VME46_18815 [Acidimicrobiales bacterium]|nr:hypothetical protein [Acidimicrobiales bacterium]